LSGGFDFDATSMLLDASSGFLPVQDPNSPRSSSRVSGRRLSLIPIDRAAFSYQLLDWSLPVLPNRFFTIADRLCFETDAAAAFIGEFILAN
jgi:hypothetical protein